MRRSGLLGLTVATSLLGACTTALYKGPKRPSAEVAVLGAQETVIERVDSVQLGDSTSGSYARYEVLPGPHELSISLNRATPGFDYQNAERMRPVVVRVALQAGHSYTAHALVNGEQWEAQVVDDETHLAVELPRPEGSPEVAASDAALADPHPGSGLSAFVGFGFGGDTLATSTNGDGNSAALNAGKGLIVGIGAMDTPFWLSSRTGLGLGLDGALKYDSISDGGVSLRRFPIALTAHLLTGGAGGRGYFVARAGLIRDFNVVYRLGSTTERLDGGFGPTASLGYYRRTNDTFAWDAQLFGALMSYTAGTQELSANTFGLTVGVHLNNE
jgi:hypothetical protein